MGIDVHCLNFIKYSRRKKPLEDVVTIGRQSLVLSPLEFAKVLDDSDDYKNDQYCEQLLINNFGSTLVESIDNNNYEGATHIFDMNDPLPNYMEGKYDTVLDGGCLEHIFDIRQALQNCSHLCKVGGQILHILPANNFCGHGFWQFSPEVFFNLYSPENGYTETEIFLANLADQERWFRVKRPENGLRVNITTSGYAYILVRTTLKIRNRKKIKIQQSDYKVLWNQRKKFSPSPNVRVNSLINFVKRATFMNRFIRLVNQLRELITSQTRLNLRNPNINVCNVNSLLE